MTVIKWLKTKLGIGKHVFTQNFKAPNKANQTQEVECFRNGKYTHSVIIHYFTKEQIVEFEKAKHKLKL